MAKQKEDKIMFQTQKVVKCYLFLIFTHFLWTHLLRSKLIINDLLRFNSRCWDLFSAYHWSKKNLINDWEIIIVYWEESERSKALANKFGLLQKTTGSLGSWQQCSFRKTLQFLSSFKLANGVPSTKLLHNDYWLLYPAHAPCLKDTIWQNVKVTSKIHISKLFGELRKTWNFCLS